MEAEILYETLRIKNIIPAMNAVDKRIFIQEVENLESYIKKLIPYRCPVCNGNGLVPNGFYIQTSGQWSSTSTVPETCQSCRGTGIVWG